MEGLWGLSVCTFVLYPAAYAAGVEDPYDTYVMFRNSQDIQRMFLLYFVAIFSYNLLAVLVTYMLDSVWHAILDNFRPISVWGVDLALFYVVTSGAFGEAWAYPGSYVQVAALGVLLYGTAVYNGSVKVPGCSYPPDAQPQLLSPMVVRASPALASSQVMKSPLATFLTLLSKSKADSVLNIEPFGADCGISITAVSCGLKYSSAIKSGLFFFK